MSTTLDQFTRETIEIQSVEGALRGVPAWRFREFALLQERRGWTITHCPSGCRIMACVFSTIETAAHAAVEIDRLRNCWTGMDAESEETLGDLRLAVGEIVNRLGGVGFPQNGPSYFEDDPHARLALNGYSASPR
jgi:hypothetical protein